MWTCTTCGRVFERKNQQHSCKIIPIEQHFKNKDLAKDLFAYLLTQISKEIGEYQIISLPCCIHLFGNYDFLAILPHKDRLEIRFAFEKEIKDTRVIQSVNLSTTLIKICIDIKSKDEIDNQLLQWLNISYLLKDKI